MKSLETAENKIEKICEVLRKETLEPAEKQALEIIQEAKKQADEMILQAEKRALDIVKKAQEDLEQTRRIFESSLMQAARQGIEYLRQEVESKLFNPELENLILNSARSPSAVAMIIEALVLAFKARGFGERSDCLYSTINKASRCECSHCARDTPAFAKSIGRGWKF